MARSKKQKRKQATRQGFYEALPMTPMPPAALPQVGEEISAGALAVYNLWLNLARRARHANWGQLRITAEQRSRLVAMLARTYAQVRGALHTLVADSRWYGRTTSVAVRRESRQLRHAVSTGAAEVWSFTPPLAHDLGAVMRRIWQALSSRRARTLYATIAIIGALTATGFGAVTAASTLSAYANDISSPIALLSKKKTGTTILDRNGQVLFEGYGGQDTKILPLKDIPKTLINATLAAEDPNFYDHPGFSWQGTARAAWVDVTHHGTFQGGSTITQQLVKNALLTSNKNFERKYQEILLAIELEHRYTKDQILEMYMNEIYYGQGASGVEAASQTYFHKEPRDLTLGESAMLAGLPLGPSRFDPNADPEAATGRRDYVLARMAATHKITSEQASAAKAQPLQLAAAGAPKTTAGGAKPEMIYSKQISIQAPWFVFYVLQQLRQQYGDDVVEQGGITVRTTLDLNKQHLAEKDVADHINALADHHVTNGGLISMTPSTGDILAMVGSTDYNAPGFGNVNVTLSDLQPGSSFKPFAYATAFKKGWNGATTVVDEPVSYPNWDGTAYAPQNYDGKFHGTVTLRHALDNSLNIPAVKVLQYATIPDTLQTAHDLGITTLNDPSRYGLSLVLGGGEVRPIDMATAYGTFANGGTRLEPKAILAVADRHGKDITKPDTTHPQPEIDPRIAYMITNILSDDTSRQPEFPANGPLTLAGRPVAAKTGTTNDFRDNWTVGYTPQMVTAVWVGNNDHSPMENVDGITGAAPIWHDYMQGALADTPPVAFAPPAGITLASVCPDGGIADGFSTGTTEAFMSDAMPTKHCGSFSLSKPSGDQSANQPAESQKKSPSDSGNEPSPSDSPPQDTFGGANQPADQQPVDTPKPPVIRTPRPPIF